MPQPNLPAPLAPRPDPAGYDTVTRYFSALLYAGGDPIPGAANGANPLSLVAPCHRVIGSNGALTGYAGGIDRKRWLLTHEGAL